MALVAPKARNYLGAEALFRLVRSSRATSAD